MRIHPGRIDHHNVQIVLWLTALAAASGMDGERGSARAALAGAATGLGLVIGLEAMLLLAAVGAAVALGFAAGRVRSSSLRAYGLALGASAVAAFLVQTPPRLWGAPVCDALGPNLAAGVAMAGAGLVLAASVERAGTGVRLGAVLLVGLAAAAAYLALEPRCVHGPFAEMNPRLHGVWMDAVQETTPLLKVWRTDPPTALSIAAYRAPIA